MHDRLLTFAKKEERPFVEVLQLFAMERFLYRLAQSRHSARFVLKGGLMLRVWDAPVTRPTKDLDLLGRTANTLANLEQIAREICQQPVAPDGLEFDARSVKAALIKANDEYHGIRIKFVALLGSARAPMQVDVGFGDEIVPEPVQVTVPTLLDHPAPSLLGYRRETTIAEKFHAMTVLGTLNTRMKDFYDLWLLSSSFEFDAATLAAAIRATFARRSTEIELRPVALTPEFGQSVAAQALWSAFLKKGGLTDAPVSFADAVEHVRAFVIPALSDPPPMKWSARRWR
ncbi:MAG: nucleotidyl transferase AbiEii/AbiGii toxin family protein [Archangium sp.]